VGGKTTREAGAVIGLVPVALFAYNGYGAAIYYVEETKNAAKTIGRVIVVCLVVTVAVENHSARCRRHRCTVDDRSPEQ
jgi:amino acid transporter